MERICSVGMNPRVAADWSARLVTVSIVKTLPIDLSEVAYIAIAPPSPPGGSETGFLQKISVERQKLSEKPGFFCLGKGRSLLRTIPEGDRTFQVKEEVRSTFSVSFAVIQSSLDIQ